MFAALLWSFWSKTVAKQSAHPASPLPNLEMKLWIHQVQINYCIGLQKEPFFYGSCLVSQQNNSQ